MLTQSKLREDTNIHLICYLTLIYIFEYAELHVRLVIL